MSRTNQFAVVRLNESQHKRAQQLCEQNPPYAGSHRGEAAMQVGFLGEIVVRDHLDVAGLDYDAVFTTRHDLVVTACGRTEVKTKDRTVSPQPNYECSVPLYNHEHQDVDYYVFVSLMRSRDNSTAIERFHTAFIVGACNRPMLNQHGTEWQAGETDPSNGTTFWTACRNIAISNLLPIDAAVLKWKQRQ